MADEITAGYQDEAGEENPMGRSGYKHRRHESAEAGNERGPGAQRKPYEQDRQPGKKYHQDAAGLGAGGDEKEKTGDYACTEGGKKGFA
jgi:hypothetical protein